MGCVLLGLATNTCPERSQHQTSKAQDADACAVRAELGRGCLAPPASFHVLAQKGLACSFMP